MINKSKPLATHKGECPRVYAISTKADGPFLFLNDNITLANDHAEQIREGIGGIGKVRYVTTTRDLVERKGNTAYLKDSYHHTDLSYLNNLFSDTKELADFYRRYPHANRWRCEVVLLCKRTNDPKLAWLEETFRSEGIRVWRDGESYHAPLLWVHPADEDAALAILNPIDDIPDDDPLYKLADGVMVTLDTGAADVVVGEVNWESREVELLDAHTVAFDRIERIDE